MTKKLHWSTISKNNVQRTDHTWKIRLIGKSEFSDAEELFKGLDSGKFTYRIINQSRKGAHCHHWIISSTCINPEVDIFLVNTPGIRAEGIDYLINYSTGEVIAERNDTTTVMVYKNTTQLEIVYRKEVK